MQNIAPDVIFCGKQEDKMHVNGFSLVLIFVYMEETILLGISKKQM